MSKTSIKVKNISKRYRIGLKNERNDTFIGDITSFLKSPLSNYRRLKKLSDFTDHENAKDIFWALKNIDFEVKQGEVMGIIGSNGAGKSTLLKILARIIDPTSGSAILNGRVASLLEVGTGFHKELTGRENTYLNGTILGMKKKEIDKKFDEIVEFSGIEQFIDTPVKRYSSGMGVRLAFSIAAHLEPEILLIDEVLAVGDAEFQKRCLGKMESIADGGRTILFVSHNMTAVRSLCDKGILLDSGSMTYEGKIDEVVKKYLSNIYSYSGVINWARPDEAPGNNQLRLASVKVGSNNEYTGTVDIFKDFNIEVEYWNLEDQAKRTVSIHLYTPEGTMVFSSSNIGSVPICPDPLDNKRLSIGRYKTICKIPKYFLNNGEHTISVFIGAGSPNFKTILSQKDILSFRVEDGGEMRNEFHGPWQGAVRPRLDWSSEKIE
tara:strand:- start:1357 stop:2664 length:1308 start_codon:yes stop_codon:yes gene_type:complete